MAPDLVSLGLVCADVMVRPVEELPERGKLALVPNLEIHLGGLAGVTATVFSQLGGRAAFIGAVGEDGFADYLLHTLEAQGVDIAGVRRRSGHGTAATVVLVSEDGERTFLHHTGASAALEEQDVDLAFVKGAKLLHWGGPAVTPGIDGEPIGRILQAAHEAGVKTSMDTCYDGEGVWLPRIEYALPHLDIVMSSIEEARMYTGQQTPEDIAAFYRSYGAETVVVKMGADGLFAVSGDETCRLPAHTVDVVDTTGAGDAACGAFLFGHLQDWGLEKCGRLANAVGALTVQHMGGAEAIESLEQAMAVVEGR